MSTIGFFSQLERDLPGMVPAAPRITTSRVRGQGNALGRDRSNVVRYLIDMFERQGLPESLARWAYSVLVEGATGTEMVQRMYNRPEFRTRFKAIFDRQKLYPNLPAISPEEVLNYERQGMQMMRAAGMPSRFYDHYSDFTQLISNDVSMNELADRVNEGFSRVQTAPRQVREAFAQFFGADGDRALAALFLDPTKALPALRLQVGAAEAAGAGMSFGFTGLSRDRALDIASRGFDYSAAADRWASLVQTKPIFDETITESDDFDVMDEGIEAVFGLEGAGESMADIERRRKERQAAFAGAGGPAVSESRGASGLGTAGQ